MLGGRSREEIIEEALLIQIDDSAIRADYFSSWDVLMVAKIGKEEIEKAKKLYQERMNLQEFLKSILV